jgi:RNA polymerase sigma-70 factor (ECF subfamily)
MLLVADSVGFMADTPPSETTETPGGTSARDALDRVRFEEEALSHADQLYRVALRLAGSQQAAEELVQEAYLRAFRGWRGYRPGTNLAAWLATILRNAFLDEARKQSRRPAQESIDDTSEYYLYNHLTETAAEPQEAVLNRLSGGAIVDSLSEIPPNFREVVVLVDIGDFSYQDAADILGVPIGTVMSRLHRGRRALKQALANHASRQEPE